MLINMVSDEIKKFDAVILEGYAYKNRNKGWRALDEYVKVEALYY